VRILYTGLGNVSYVGKDEVNKFGTTIIDALMCSIDSPDEITAMEAMNGLSKIFELIDEVSIYIYLIVTNEYTKF
jgi:hypothetical protein